MIVYLATVSFDHDAPYDLGVASDASKAIDLIKSAPVSYDRWHVKAWNLDGALVGFASGARGDLGGVVGMARSLALDT